MDGGELLMAVDKLVDSTQLDSDLTSVANAIRTKGGTSASLAFPAGFVSAIAAIPSGGGGISISDIATGAFPDGDVVYDGTTIVDYAFAYRTQNHSWKFYGQNVTTIGQNTFRGCTYITELHLPKMSSYSSTGYLAYGCSRLKVVDYGVMGTVRGNTFNNCTAFDTLILRKSDGVAALANVNTFNGSCFASGKSGGTIYIPKVLYDHLGDNSSLDYKHATNWSTLNGYGTVTWAKIEGSIYEL